MIMSFLWVLLCIATLLCENASQAFVTVSCKPQNVGHYGQPSVVECVVKMAEEAKGAKLLKVFWKKGTDKLLVFEDGNLQEAPGYTFADPSWNEENMRVSLLINNTVMADSGEYKCFVLTESGHAQALATLSVTAKYSKPNVTAETNPSDGHRIFVCKSEGGFPEGELNWYDMEQKKLDGETEVKQEENGLYTLTNKLRVKQDSRTYICKVTSGSGDNEEESTNHAASITGDGETKPVVTNQPQVNPTQIVAPLVVIGSLIVGLLLVILYRKRHTQARRPSAAPLMGFHEPVETNCNYEDQLAIEDETANPAAVEDETANPADVSQT